MFWRKKFIFFSGVLCLALFFTLAITGTAKAVPLSCSVIASSTCTAISGGVVILRMSGSSNAHAALPSQPNASYDGNVICCSGVFGLSNTCSGAYVTTSVLRLNGATNAHVQQSGSYPNRTCLSVPTGGSVSLFYGASCSGYDTTLGSMSAADNAHVGNAAAYPSNLICASASFPDPSFTSLITCPSGGDRDIACGVAASPEYTTGNTDGLIYLTGTNFGSTAGTLQWSGGGGNFTIHAIAEGACATGGWTNTSVCAEVSPLISSSTYGGILTLTRSDGRITAGGLTLNILPRITSNNPVSGLPGDTIAIRGDHFCKNAICPGSPPTIDFIAFFGTTQALSSDFVTTCPGGSKWNDSQVCVKIPAAATPGAQNNKIQGQFVGHHESQRQAFTVLSPATKIYYSVGQNTFDHKTGSPHITISNGATTSVATFDVAQTATNIGVGDQISYGSAGATTTAYISAKQSTTVWNVITRIGAQPTATTSATVLKISHAFNSLENTVTGASGSKYLNTSDLVAGNYILNIPCYYDSGPDTTAVSVTGWNTGSSNYIKIYTPNNTAAEVNLSQRHSGKWNTGKYSLEVTGGVSAIFIAVNYVRIDGLQVKSTDSTSNNNDIIVTASSISGASEVSVSNSIVQGVMSGSSIDLSGISNWSTITVMKVFNNIVYNVYQATGNVSGICNGSTGVMYAYNNTVYGNQLGLRINSGTLISKNNLSYNNTDNYNGGFAASSTNNLSGPSQADAPGSSPRNAATVSFINTSGTNFHLSASDTGARDYGVDLSGDKYLPFTTDIDGQTRTGSWDIGADEYVAPVISGISTSTTVNSATINWTTNVVATSSVKYGTTTAYGLASSSNNFITSHSLILKNLKSNTTYHFQISSTDAPGVTATSSDLTFTTTIGMPATGQVTSVIYDTTQSATILPTYNSIMWLGSWNGSTGRVRFQLATSNSTGGPWNYFGSPDNGVTCNSSAWYDPGATSTPIEISCAPANHNNQRYYRYKVQICSKSDCATIGSNSPIVNDVMVNWSP